MTERKTERPTSAEFREAVRVQIRYLGDDPDREGLLETPGRVMRWYDELREEGEEQINGTIFTEAHDDLVIVRGIWFRSLCEHHLLPFEGSCTIGYLAQGEVLGLSKFARVVSKAAARLSVQERLTREVAETIRDMVHSDNVGVVTVAEHSCMTIRGVKAHGSETIVSSMLGAFRGWDSGVRAEFLSLARTQS